MWHRNSCISIGFVAAALTLVPSGRGSAKEPPAPAKPILSLLASSHHILDLDALRNWLQQDGSAAVEPFNDPIWLSPQMVLVHDNFADGNFLAAYQLNLRTGEKRGLPKLTHVIAQNDAFKPGDWQLSSDGKWLLWREGWLGKEYSLVATRVDGSRSIRWSAPRAAQNAHKDSYFWIPGTYKWINLYSETGGTFASAQMYDLDSPHSFRSISLASLRIGAHFLGRASDGTIWSADDDESDDKKRQVTLTAFQLEASALIRRFVVTMPKGNSVRQIETSPDGRTLAWLAVSENGSDFTLLLSKLNGTGIHAVARQSFGEDGGDVSLDGWTANCKALLFEITIYSKNSKRRSELRELPVRWPARSANSST